MREESDEDALSWGDEADPTHVDAPGETVIERLPGDGTRTGSALLIVYGVVGGAYLLYLVGWVIAVQRDTLTLPTLFGEIMYQFGEFLAIASPALWLAAVLVLTRDRRPVARLCWLAVGLLVVAPWPFFLAGVA